ncbi:MAG: hypothetical protein Q9163_003375 [Psora crenata]
MTAPPFILGTTSLTEFSAYWTEHPSIFVAPAAEQDPAKRALLVLKWFLTTLKQSYSSRNDKYGSEKKPLNPFLGELFLGKWEDEAGTTHLVSEQVRHDQSSPSSYSLLYLERKAWCSSTFLPPTRRDLPAPYCTNNFQLQGYNAQKASFSRTIHIKQIGHAVYTLSSHNETYLITLPSLHIEGLIYGKPFVELNNCTYITSSSGYMAKIDYSGKGWLSGKKNSFVATLYPIGKEKEILYTIEGQWNESFSIKAGGGSGIKKHSELLETFNSKTSKTTPLLVSPLNEQGPYESNRAWQHVAAGIQKGDMDIVHVEKSKIENAQRELRRKELAEGREWQRRFFKKLEGNADEVFEKLAKQCGERIEADKTAGVWRFDESKKAEREGRAVEVNHAPVSSVS